MDNLVSKINFFSNNALFEEIKDSNSGAILKKVTDNNQTYFLKIVFKENVDVVKIKKIIEIYEKYNINTIKLLDYGYIDNRVYLIYNFIDGKALNTVYDQYSPNDYYHMGFNIGDGYRKINSTLEFNNYFINDYNINDLVITI